MRPDGDDWVDTSGKSPTNNQTMQEFLDDNRDETMSR